METLDEDGDGECDFQEFMAFIAMVTTACHEFFEHEWDREGAELFLREDEGHSSNQNTSLAGL